MMPKSKLSKQDKPESYYASRPWQCRHHEDHSELLAYVEAIGDWETVAVIRSTAEVSASKMTQFIANVINDSQHHEDLLRNAIEALELCLEEGSLTYASELSADITLNRIKQRIK